MTLPDMANIATTVEAIVVIVSVFLIWYQLRQSTQLTRAANTQSLVTLSSPFNLQLAQDRKLAELWVRGSKEFAKMDEVDRCRYRFLLFHSMTLQENIYYQWKEKLIDDKTYESWRCSFEAFVHEHSLQLHWSEIKGYYQPDFANYIGQLLERDAAKARPEKAVHVSQANAA
jgi:hypothetical protein